MAKKAFWYTTKVADLVFWGSIFMGLMGLGFYAYPGFLRVLIHLGFIPGMGLLF